MRTKAVPFMTELFYRAGGFRHGLRVEPLHADLSNGRLSHLVETAIANGALCHMLLDRRRRGEIHLGSDQRVDVIGKRIHHDNCQGFQSLRVG